MEHQHAAVWIDHRQAHVVRFGVHGSTIRKIRSRSNERQVHHKANSIGYGRAAPDIAFYEQVVKALADAAVVLVTGPSFAKVELVNYITRRHPDLAKTIVGAEPLDHPSDGELLKFATNYLRAADRLQHG